MNSARKLLLVDDDPDIADMVDLLVSGFRRGPFVLEHVAEYEAGLERLLSGQYALCLLDYHLGPRDGLELLREAKAARCPTPIILLTGSGREETDIAAMDRGAADYLEKSELTPHGLERSVCYALEMAEAMARLRDLATHDPLTGAINRSEFDRRLQEEWERSIARLRPLALVMLDLDHFKQINDVHGHQMGDEVLRHVVRVVVDWIRPVDCLARYGGDEFALILVDTDRAAARAKATQLCGLIGSTPFPIPAKDLSLTLKISAGVAVLPEDANSLAGLIAAADSALYSAKGAGRNRVVAAGA